MREEGRKQPESIKQITGNNWPREQKSQFEMPSFTADRCSNMDSTAKKSGLFEILMTFHLKQ